MPWRPAYTLAICFDLHRRFDHARGGGIDHRRNTARLSIKRVHGLGFLRGRTFAMCSRCLVKCLAAFARAEGLGTVAPLRGGRSQVKNLTCASFSWARPDRARALRPSVSSSNSESRRSRPETSSGSTARTAPSSANAPTPSWPRASWSTMRPCSRSSATELRRPDAQDGFILDGFPRTQAQAEALTALMRELATPIDAVVLFEVGADELVRRISGRRTCSLCNKVFNIYSAPPAVAGRRLRRRAATNTSGTQQVAPAFRRRAEP